MQARVLYGSNGYLLDRLQSVLNSPARLILGVPELDSVSAAIRNELHWLPIMKRIQFKIALLVRHCIVGAAPEYLRELCRPVNSSSGRQSLRSASRGDLIVPRFWLRRSGYRAFSVSGPVHVWNSLPTEIRQSCNNLSQFKSKLKTFLFQQSWALLWIHIWWGALQILYTITTTTTILIHANLIYALSNETFPIRLLNSNSSSIASSGMMTT